MEFARVESVQELQQEVMALREENSQLKTEIVFLKRDVEETEEVNSSLFKNASRYKKEVKRLRKELKKERSLREQENRNWWGFLDALAESGTIIKK